MADKLREKQELEALQKRYIGTGSADTSAEEFHKNVARDSLSSYVGHPPLLTYMSIGLGQPREKTRTQMLEKMAWPIGTPPPKPKKNTSQEMEYDVGGEKTDDRATRKQKETEMETEGEVEGKEQKQEERMPRWPGSQPWKEIGMADEHGFGPDGRRARY